MSDDDNATGVPHFLDDVQRVDRKRVRLDSSGRKRWSLTDRQGDQEVLQEMGVGILDPDDPEQTVDSAGCSYVAGMLKSESKRKRDIENVSPNVNRQSPGRPSPHRGKPARSPAAARCSPRSAEKPGAERSSAASLEAVLSERSLNESSDPADEETPLPLLPAAGLQHRTVGVFHSSPGICSSVGSADWPTSGGSRDGVYRVPSSCSGGPSPYTQDEDCLREESVTSRGARGAGASAEAGADAFAGVSDEVMLHIFKWLTKRSLVRCTLVCRKWHRVASDESLWQRLELGERTLSRGALGRILARKPVVLRLASTEIGEWDRPADMGPCKLQYLDLSMCVVDSATLHSLLECCPALRRLSLETLHTDERTCELIGQCPRLETLNLTMATGLTTNGMISILRGCTGLQSLNISWCKLSAMCVRYVCGNAPRHLQRLNVAGARVLTDDMIERLVTQCPRLLELDVSDCTRVTETGLRAVTRLDRLEHLALSRCYLLTPQSLLILSGMSKLQYLEVWGMLQTAALASLRAALSAVSINQFMLSAIARPTVGPRRTSIWGYRTRD